MRLCLIFLLFVSLVRGQGFELLGRQLFQPEGTKCVLKDTYSGPFLNTTTCDFRSDGCVYETKNCKLATILGYTLGNFMEITPTVFSAIDPVTADAKINYTVVYNTSSSSIFAVRGFVQLWQFVSVNPTTNVDVYKFTHRQQYINQMPLTTPSYTFNDLTVGKYIIVYWDVGGTRYGLGEPESSLPFTVQSVFPSPVSDLNLDVSIVLQQRDFEPGTGKCINVNFLTSNMWVEYPYSKYYNLWTGTNQDKTPYFSVEITSPSVSQVSLLNYINNAPSAHRRWFYWVQQSDQGNVINVKTEPIPATTGKFDCTYCNANVNMTLFCSWCSSLPGFSSPACASCSAPSPTFCGFCGGITSGKCNTVTTIQNDNMLKFKVAPIITGSYGIAKNQPRVSDPVGDNPVGIFEWDRDIVGRKSLFTLRLGYSGLGLSKYGDFWRMRQSYGDATTVAQKVVDQVQVDIVPAWNYLQIDTGRTTTNASGEVWRHAHVEKYGINSAVPRGEEWLVTYFFGRHRSRFGQMGSNGMVGTYADMYHFIDLYLNTPSGDTCNSGDDCPTGQYCRLDSVFDYSLPHCNLVGAELFKFKIKFEEHSNTDDYSCYPLETNYALNHETGNQNVQSYGNPCIFHQSYPFPTCNPPAQANPVNQNALKYTFADIRFGTEYGQELFDDCDTDQCENTGLLGDIFYPFGQALDGVTECRTLSNNPSNPRYITPCTGRFKANAGGAARTTCQKCCLGHGYYLTYPGGGTLSSQSNGNTNVWNSWETTDKGFFNGGGYVSTARPPWSPVPIPPFSGTENIQYLNYGNTNQGTDASRADQVCAGWVNGRKARTRLMLGASSICDYARILNMSMNGPWGEYLEDPSNAGFYTGNPNENYPSQTPPSVFGRIKDCAAGPWHRFYRLQGNRRSALRDNQRSYPYYQMTIDFPTRNLMLENEVSNPIFLVPGYFASANAVNNNDLGTPSGPLELQSPVYVTSYPGGIGENVMSIGQDIHMVSLQYVQEYQMGNGDYDPTTWNVQMFSSYARFKVVPTIVFRHFRNAIPQRGSVPAMIDVTFRVSCPFLDFNNHYKSEGTYDPAWCAEGWYITNQRNETITLGMKKGPGFLNDTDPMAVFAYTGLVAGPGVGKTRQIINGARSDEVVTLSIVYTDGDVLHWGFNIRSESEKPFGTSAGLCRYSTDTERSVALGKYRYVPDKVTVAVPPQAYVFVPLEAGLTIAPPVCSYNTPAAVIYPRGSAFFAWETPYELDLAGVTSNGGTIGDLILSEYLYYYYKWTFIGQSPSGGDETLQGFVEQFQSYSPPFTTQVCDRITCVNPTIIDFLPPPPINSNIFKRPTRCVDPTEDTWGCSVNIDDTPTYSGITQEPYCRISSTTGRPTNSILFQPLFVLESPWTMDNVRSYYFNITTAYVSPILFTLQNIGIFEQQDQFVIDQDTVPSGDAFVSLYVQFGVTEANLLESPCYENFITHAYILSDFIVSQGPIERINGCSRPDGCCYFLPLIVSGTSPFTGQPVTLTGISAPYNQVGNVTDLCFASPACIYEVVVSPPLNVDGGICLGATYTYTVQTPQFMVDNRVGPPVGLSNYTIFNSTDFNYPYRCPTTFTESFPPAGISPVDVSTIPGTCESPGTAAKFTFQYTDPACTGPISMDNPVVACRKNLSFALAAQNGDPTYPNSAPAGPFGTGFSLSNPYIIKGVYAFTYNVPGVFEFPEFYAPPQLPFGGFDSIPNGYWNAYFWIGGPLYSQVADVRLKQEANFVASLKGLDGLVIVRTFLNRPLCPGPPIQIGVRFNDLSYRGPYLVRFTEPRGGVISAINFTCAGLPCSPLTNCTDVRPDYALLPTEVARKEACDTFFQQEGVSLTLQVGTGDQTPGPDGGYAFFVGAEGGTCGSEYVEFMNAMPTLRMNIECWNTTCPGGVDGYVDVSAVGGTPIPFINQTTLLGSHLDRWIPLYRFNWTTPLGYLSTPMLLRVPEGEYSATMCDFNGCCVQSTPASCRVRSSTPPMQLIPTSAVAGNCTGDPATAEFTVIGGEAPYTLFRISNNTVQVGSGYEILADTKVLPGQPATYIVVDSRQCVSPEVSFQINGSIDFRLTARVVFSPCNVNTATGRILATVTPAGLGTVLVWTNLNTGQVVFDNSNSFGYPYLDNAPAGAYRVTATSLIYGCSQSVTVNLAARAPPQISASRTAVSSTRDRVTGFIVSDNGPPYVTTFTGMPTNTTEDNDFDYETSIISNTTQIYSIVNLLCTVSYTMQITDAGGCINSIFSPGRTVTQIDVLQSPTPLPQTEYNQTELIELMRSQETEEDNRLMTLVMGGMLGACVIFALVLLFGKRKK